MYVRFPSRLPFGLAYHRQMSKRGIFCAFSSPFPQFILRRAREWGATSAEVVAELRYNLDSSYSFHRQKTVDVEVDFLRFEV